MSTGLPPCPQGPTWDINEEQLLCHYEWLRDLAGCAQDPMYHGEGDVLVHTMMVARELVRDPAWRALPPEHRSILFSAALLHDVAKPVCTEVMGGKIRSPGHARRGEKMARALLWRAGVDPKQREAIAGLVRYHQMPYLLWDRPDPAGLVRRISLQARCDHLALLARADIRGRICPDTKQQFENIDLFVAQAEEIGCLRGPVTFASDHSRFLYFRKEARDPGYEAWDDTTCEVTMMCGLPGAGKNHWLEANVPGLPVVSLDAVRRQMNIGHKGNQGAVAHKARTMAREHLREKRDFAWNATNLTRELRSSLINLFAGYGARVRIVFVDPPAQTLLRQNRNREAKVPPRAILNMASRLEFPTLSEVHEIVWVTDFHGPAWERAMA